MQSLSLSSFICQYSMSYIYHQRFDGCSINDKPSREVWVETSLFGKATNQLHSNENSRTNSTIFSKPDDGAIIFFVV